MVKGIKDLAPGLLRQRIVIEGTTDKIAGIKEIEKYLVELAKVAKMEILSGPFAYSAQELGFGGWVHWRTSGSHVYSYPTSPPLVTVDIYTCKWIDPKAALDFTKKFFKIKDVVCKEI